MRPRLFALAGLLAACAAGGTLVRGQQPPPQGGIGQTPSPLPLTQTIRERGSSVTPAFEGWYYDKDGSVRLLIGYFNRNLKQEFDIPAGPNNPVGVVWIDINKEHFGLHGTPEPSAIGQTESHGCIRLTNWDATRLARLVSPGTKVILQ